MVERGLVERFTDPENRVRVRVLLTDAGWQLFKLAVQESDMLESDVLRTLAPRDRIRMAELLEQAIEGLDALDT